MGTKRKSEGASPGAEFQLWTQVMSEFEKTASEGEDLLKAMPRFPLPMPRVGEEVMMGWVSGSVFEGWSMGSRMSMVVSMALASLPWPLPWPLPSKLPSPGLGDAVW